MITSIAVVLAAIIVWAICNACKVPTNSHSIRYSSSEDYAYRELDQIKTNCTFVGIQLGVAACAMVYVAAQIIKVIF